MRIHYAVPARQIVAAILTVFAAIGAVVACALLIPSAGLATFAGFVVFAMMLWQLALHVKIAGDAVFEAEELVITPRRWSPCAPRGVIRIPWAEVERVQQGVTAVDKYFSILRTRQPKRSWILMPVEKGEVRFHQQLLEHINAARTGPGSEPLEARNPYDSRGWRIFAGSTLLLLILAIAGMLLAGRSSDRHLWLRILGLACFAIPLAMTVFGTARRK